MILEIHEITSEILNCDLCDPEIEVITFDDGLSNNIKVLGRDDSGKLIIDPNSAVGILEEFKNKYPDYNITATFFINSNLFNQSEYNEEIEAIGIKESSKKIAEIGRCMVLSGYRGQNLMVKVNEALIKEAENNGIDILVATAHPDNIPSNKSFEKLGFKKCCTKTLWGDYLRNIYMKNVKK